MWYNIKAIRMNGLRRGSRSAGEGALFSKPFRGYTHSRKRKFKNQTGGYYHGSSINEAAS
jgi:hypothetical protein